MSASWPACCSPQAGRGWRPLWPFGESGVVGAVEVVVEGGEERDDFREYIMDRTDSVGVVARDWRRRRGGRRRRGQACLHSACSAARRFTLKSRRLSTEE